MTITQKNFKHIVELAYLDFEDVVQQFEKCRATITEIEQLQTVDTSQVSPMHHPSSITQYLRPDNHVMLPKIEDLASTASAFENNLYTVPLILKGS